MTTRTTRNEGGSRPVMHRLFRLFSTSVGRKLLMAATGLLLLGFLLVHLLGNMSIFQGQNAINSYAAWLQGHPFLWVLRAGLALVFTIHVWVAVQLSIENRAARPLRYEGGRHFETSGTSRYMLLTGILVVVFLVYHILDFTLGIIDPGAFAVWDAQGRHDVYSMVVRSFQNPWLAGSYIVAMVLIGFHLAHACHSLFQTVGINHDSYNGAIRFVSRTMVAVFVVGNCSFPILVLTGVIGLPGAK